MFLVYFLAILGFRLTESFEMENVVAPPQRLCEECCAFPATASFQLQRGIAKP